MADLVSQLLNNEPIVSALTAWALAALLKFLIVAIQSGKFDWERILGTGGMPSTHTTPIIACATSIGLVAGFQTPVFGLAAALCFVVAYDAAGIRRHAGAQAQAINNLIKDLTNLETFKGQKLESFFKRWNVAELKTLLGHNPIEVWVGIIIGILTALIIHNYFGHMFNPGIFSGTP